MNRTIAASAILSLSLSVLPASAANDRNAGPAGSAPPATTEAAAVKDHAANTGTDTSADNGGGNVADSVAENLLWGEGLTRGTSQVRRSLSRPAALPALYISYAALQGFDVYSTRQALARGAREANPLMEGAVGNTATFIAVKAGVGVATIMAAERLWKTNKLAAIAVMVASNSVSAVVAARNARTLRQLR